MVLKTHTSNPRAREQGYLLLGLLFLVAILLITLALAAPEMGKQIQREKDVEAIHRADQYKRAIQLYYKQNGGQYPTSIDQLKNTNNVKYLRQEYVDPITGKKDWIFLHLGQVPMIKMGLFGQMSCGAVPGAPVMPVSPTPGGSDPTGANPNGSNLNGSNPNGSATGSTNSTSSADNPCGGGNLGSLKTDDGFFSAKDDTFASDTATDTSGANGTSGPEKSAMPTLPVGGNSGGPVGYEGPSGMMGNGPIPGAPNSTSAFGGAQGGQGGAFGGSTPGGGAGFAGNPQGAPGAGGVGSSSGASSPFGSDSGSSSGGTGTLGGGPIVGVSIPRRAASIVTYQKQKIYNHWAIVYNPADDNSMNPGGEAAPGTLPQSPGVGGTGAVGFNSGSIPGQNGSTSQGPTDNFFNNSGSPSSGGNSGSFGSSSNGSGSPGMGGSMPGQQPSSGYGSQSSPNGGSSNGGFGSP